MNRFTDFDISCPPVARASSLEDRDYVISIVYSPEKFRKMGIPGTAKLDEIFEFARGGQNILKSVFMSHIKMQPILTMVWVDVTQVAQISDLDPEKWV